MNIINDSLGFEQPDFYHYYHLSDTKYPERKLKGMEFLFIEIPKFRAGNFTEQRASWLWLKYLAYIENKTDMIPKELMEVPEIAEAISLLKESSYTTEELEQYDRYWDIISTQKTIIHDAKEEGFEQGLEQGKVETEHRKNVDMILKGIKNGISTEVLSDMSGLSVEEVQKIIDEHITK